MSLTKLCTINDTSKSWRDIKLIKLQVETLHEERSLSVRRGRWEEDPSSNLVFSEGKRMHFLKSEFSEYLTGEVTAGMNRHHLINKLK